MKALVLSEYNKFEIKDVAMPTLQPDEVLVNIKAVGICGSDVHGMDGSTGRRRPPIIMGHEAAGMIVSVGSQVKSWKADDRVTFDSTIYRLDDWYSRRGMYNLSDNRVVLGVSCAEFKRDGAFAEYVAVPQHILYRIPGSVSYEHAAMVEPIAVALHAVRLTNISLNDSVLVGGAGIIGLFLIQLLRQSGCGRIIAFDVNEERLTLAQQLGATNVLNASTANVAEIVRSLTDGRGADVGFDVVGVPAVITRLVESVRKGASITLIGNVSAEVPLPLQKVVTRQLKLQGSCAICGEYEAVLDLLARGAISVDPMMSAVAPLDEGAKWFDRLYRQEKGLLKVILKP